MVRHLSILTERGIFMKRKLLYRIFLGLLVIVVAQPFNSCKKVDLERTAFVKTVGYSDVKISSARVNGQVIDLGENEVIEYGFAYSTSGEPTVNNQVAIIPGGATLGDFSATIAGLNPNTQYFVRGYLKFTDEVIYAASSLSFTTLDAAPTNAWLHYDNGENFDGIGMNAGGDFDVAIRFAPSDIAEYDGWTITKIKFFPKVGSPIVYTLEILTGATVPTLDYSQELSSVSVDQWNEITLNTPFIIDASTDLWVGYWVQNQPALTYPVGCDQGPAVAGKGDMISVDGLASWSSLSTLVPTLNYNFNIQIYVIDQTGIEKQMVIGEKPAPFRIPFTSDGLNTNSFGSFNQSLKK
jgi:hypothetical protein